MASPVPKLPGERVNRNPKQRGEWRASPGYGWQHGPIPAPPPKLLQSSRQAWGEWMRSWFASNWTPDDLPGLRVVITLHDRVMRGDTRASAELRQMMDNYGITPKGQQDRRWLKPKPQDDRDAAHAAAPDVPAPYAGLDLVN